MTDASPWWSLSNLRYRKTAPAEIVDVLVDDAHAGAPAFTLRTGSPRWRTYGEAYMDRDGTWLASLRREAVGPAAMQSRHMNRRAALRWCCQVGGLRVVGEVVRPEPVGRVNAPRPVQPPYKVVHAWDAPATRVEAFFVDWPSFLVVAPTVTPSKDHEP